MVIAHHLILTGYGHWLPNDPRGSLSSELRAGKLYPLGDIHYGRKKSQQTRSELREFQKKARTQLKHKVLWFDDAERQAIAKAFSKVVVSRKYTCFACAILSNHAHLVIRKHRDPSEMMIAELQKASAELLRRLAPVTTAHPIWSGDIFKKFISTPEALEETIQYVVDNPAKSGLPPQMYEFVKSYRGEWGGKSACARKPL